MSDGKPKLRRISVDLDDRGYLPPDERRLYEIRLNGEPMRDVITADTRIGIIKRPQKDSRGNLVHDGEFYAVETLHGDVEIVRKGR